MSPSELEEHVFREPFIPLRLTLASGDQVIIDNPRRVLIVGLSLHYGVADTPEARIAKRGIFISIPNIALIEQINPHPRRNGRRRR